MKRNFHQVIADLRGKPVRVNLSAETLLRALDSALRKLDPAQAEIVQKEVMAAAGEPLTMKDACADALTGALPGDENLALGERSKRMALAMKIYSAFPGDATEITSDERDVIKQCVNKYFKGVLVPASVAQMLDGE